MECLKEPFRNRHFDKARQKIDWKACLMLHEKLVGIIYGHDYLTWRGYRAAAVDGSKLQLPADKRLKKDIWNSRQRLNCSNSPVFSII
ncbi:MAG: hypothetical protein LBJ64_11095 [Deltaproteobacteria bacterium]|nr:hypothetical protein [Deltaproteobacteria bacterium]